MCFEPRDYLRHILVEADYLINQGDGLTADRFMAMRHFGAPSSGVWRSSERPQRRFRMVFEHDMRGLNGAPWLECATGSFMATSALITSLYGM